MGTGALAEAQNSQPLHLLSPCWHQSKPWGCFSAIPPPQVFAIPTFAHTLLKRQAAWLQRRQEAFGSEI